MAGVQQWLSSENCNILKKLAQILSVILHPIFLPLIGFLLIYFIGGYSFYLPQNIFWFTVLLWVQFTIVIPLSVLLIMSWSGKIASIYLDNIKERPIPLLINTLSYFVIVFLFYRLNYPKIFLFYTIILTLISFFTFVSSFFIKISLHTVGWGTFLGIMISYSLIIKIDLSLLISIIIFLSAIIMSIRLYLNKHTVFQVYIAWIGALLISMLLLFLWR